jgi:hypothetical protein
MAEAQEWVTDPVTDNRFCLRISGGKGDLYGSYIPQGTFVFKIAIWKAIAECRSEGVILTTYSNIEWAEDGENFRIWIRNKDSKVPISAQIPKSIVSILFQKLPR